MRYSIQSLLDALPRPHVKSSTVVTQSALDDVNRSEAWALKDPTAETMPISPPVHHTTPTPSPPPPPPPQASSKSIPQWMATNSPSSHASRSLSDLAQRLATHGPVKTLATSRRIRILFNGAMIADTLDTSGALYVWEHDRYPYYYLPLEAFIQPPNFTVHLTPGDSIEDPTTNQIIGGGLKLSVKRASDNNSHPTDSPTSSSFSSPSSTYKHLTAMVLFAADLTGPGRQLCNMVKVAFDAVDTWFEEDIPIQVHPKDPFKRIDILPCTSRAVRILVNDLVVAHSPISLHLHETGLPVRYYIPLTAVDASLLRSSDSVSLCPYKGEAEYYSLVTGREGGGGGEVLRDLLWFYPRPTIECAAIAGYCCFYNEIVDVEFEVRSGASGKGGWRRVERAKSHFV